MSEGLHRFPYDKAPLRTLAQNDWACGRGVRHDTLIKGREKEASAGKDREVALEGARLGKSVADATEKMDISVIAKAAEAMTNANALCAVGDCSKLPNAATAMAQLAITAKQKIDMVTKKAKSIAENELKSQGYEDAVTEAKDAVKKVEDANKQASSQAETLTKSKEKLLERLKDSAEKEATYTAQYNHWQRARVEAERQAERLKRLKEDDKALEDAEQEISARVENSKGHLQQAVESKIAARDIFMEQAALRKDARQREWDARSRALALTGGRPRQRPLHEDDFNSQVVQRSEQVKESAEKALSEE